MPRYVEVSHTIEAGMTTYPGLPEPTVEVLMDYNSSRPRYDDKAEFFIASLHLCGNTGTYVDSPRHRYRDGADFAGLDPHPGDLHREGWPLAIDSKRVRPHHAIACCPGGLHHLQHSPVAMIVEMD